MFPPTSTAAEHIRRLRDALIYLAAAVIAVPLFTRFGLGAVLGYLIAGMVIGPSVLKLINEPETVLGVAEFGVVLLLFLVGLELNPRKLWQLRVPIFGMGGLQVFVTAGLVTGALLLMGERGLLPTPAAAHHRQHRSARSVCCL